MKRILFILIYIGLFWMSGCGYKLVGQGSLPKHIQKIAIPIFENTTLEKGVEDTITQAIIDVYVKGGKLRLVSETEADAILRGKIRFYNSKEVSAYNEQNQVSSYKLTVAIDVELQDLTNNEVLWKTENLAGSEDFAGGPDVDITKEQDNEDSALQTVAKDLAERVWALSTEGF
jgi:outer membrane lipopolysaccharide assembly protein LptE/RlpB